MNDKMDTTQSQPTNKVKLPNQAVDLDTILAEWEVDAKIDKNEVGDEALATSKLHAKYLRYLMSHKMALKAQETLYAKYKPIMWQYYKGRLNEDKEWLKEMELPPFVQHVDKDIGMFLDGDERILKIIARKAIHEEAVTTCELILKELNQRTWQCRAAIDWEKYTKGYN